MGERVGLALTLIFERALIWLFLFVVPATSTTRDTTDTAFWESLSSGKSI